MAEYCEACGQHHNRKALLMADAILNGKKSIETARGTKKRCGLASMIDFEDVGEKRYAEYWFIRREVVNALKKARIKASDELIDMAIPYIDKKISETILFFGDQDVIVAKFKEFRSMSKDQKQEVLDAIVIK